MNGQSRNDLVECLLRMQRPLARFCIEHALTVQDAIEVIRVAFVNAAADEITQRNQKVNISRLSIMTGLQRQAVERIYSEGLFKEANSRIDKIIGQWRFDRRFLNSRGKPRILTVEGSDSEFNRLVRSVHKELHPGSVLFELTRLGAVEKTKRGVRLKGVSYEQRANAVEGMKLLARDIGDLIHAVSQNIRCHEAPPNYHAASIFDNLAEEDLQKIQQWLQKSCARFHTKVEKFLSARDLDLKPDKSKKGGKRVSFTSFTRVG